MFVGESLRNLRVMFGFSRKHLSDLVGVSEQSIWQYENGVSSPKLETINELKNIFHVKSKYFYKADILSKQSEQKVEPHSIAYRSEEINSVSKTQSESLHCEFLNEFVEFITSKVSLPMGQIGHLRSYAQNMMKDLDIGNRVDAINEIAQYTREVLSIPDTSNKNLIFYIEKSGVYVFEKSIGEKIDAYSFWTKTDIPYIVLGNLKKSAVRRNFDLAHELGHLILHHNAYFTELDKKTYSDIEKEADLFAGAFLLPVKEFTNDFNFLIRKSNPDSYIELKTKWLVSIQAMAIRAKRLGLLTQEQYSYFWRSITKKGYKKSEPLDYEIPIFKPSKIESILKLLLENKVITLNELTEAKYSVDIEYLHLLTGISREFFAKYKRNEETVSLDFQKIVRLK
ncbi:MULTISPECIES: ImmA/IrrE family metallo-endopeptidase [unclassified Exiguobacterium]|uniref:spr1629 family repressor/antitoxin n=1 Tax=unclassified Exiguobacterium TaxID=2644629 RepID=UPI001BE7140C|nr:MULTISPECIES: XRE family transcriptional regulator [unclassified Exiguobacterium]